MAQVKMVRKNVMNKKYKNVHIWIIYSINLVADKVTPELIHEY